MAQILVEDCRAIKKSHKSVQAMQTVIFTLQAYGIPRENQIVDRRQLEKSKQYFV